MHVTLGLSWLADGIGGRAALDAASFLLRVWLGVWMYSARSRYIYDPAQDPGKRWRPQMRVQSLRRKIASYGFSEDYAPILADVVAFIEVVPAALLVLGLFTPLADFTLLVLMAYIGKLVWKDKVESQITVGDRQDYICSTGWRVEYIYVVIAFVILLLGPGHMSVDWWLWRGGT